MIRVAQPRDVVALADLVMKLVGLVDIGDLLPSRPRVVEIAQKLISDKSGLVMVHDGHNGIDGCIAVAVTDLLCFERKSACILCWYAETPRTGYAMLRMMIAWSRGRQIIKAVGFSADFGMDPRVGVLLERVGLKRRGSVFARY